MDGESWDLGGLIEKSVSLQMHSEGEISLLTH